MKNEKTQKNIFVRIFSIFKSKRARNVLYFTLIIFATISMFLIDKFNLIRDKYLSFLNNNILSDAMDFFGIARYEVTSGAWVLFIILMTLTLMILIGNIVAPKFVANKVKENPDLFSTEKKTRIFYFILFYGVLALIAAVIVVVAYFAGAFEYYDETAYPRRTVSYFTANSNNPFISLLIMLAIFLGILFAALIIVVLVYTFIKILFMALTGQFITRSKKNAKKQAVAATEAAAEEIAPAAEEVAPAAEETNEEIPVAPVASPKLEIDDIDRKVIQKSFVGKMSQASKAQKEFYNELKNHILSYNRVNSRTSWHYDSFNIGRQKAIKIAFRGQTMVAFFALDPKKYEDTKYYPHDMSNKKKFADTPMMVKIKSERGVKFAKELVDAVCEGLPAKKNFVPATYKFAHMSDKKLIENGLAKEVSVKI